jgi:hypothetical protein
VARLSAPALRELERPCEERVRQAT